MLVVSGDKGEFVDMGRMRSDCKGCGKEDVHFAVRLCTRDLDRYSTTTSSRRFVILACQECASEFPAGRDIERWAMLRYDAASNGAP
jgi:hypothetical protein